MSRVDLELGSYLDIVEPVLSAIVKDAIDLALSAGAPILVLSALAHPHDQPRLAGVARNEEIAYI
jgi:hypothetical protein